MDDQPPSLQNPKTHQNEVSQTTYGMNSAMEADQVSETQTAEFNDTDGELPPRRHRRRSRHQNKESKSRAEKKGVNQHSKRRNKTTGLRLTEKILIGGCCLLGLLTFFAGGVFVGQKFAPRSDTAQVVQQDAPLPTPEAETLLDMAFTAFHQGNYRDAMNDFQKVQDKQPALFGLDYLIAESSYKAGENVLAEEAAGHAISKNEAVEQARVLQALINLARSKSGSATESLQLADPNVTAETVIKQLAATHLGDAQTYALWGDFLRSNGSYRSAAEILHKGVLRADPQQTRELLSAKEQLALLEDNPAKTAPSLSDVTSMNGEQALVAALASLQLHQDEEASSFLEHARDLYAPQIFRELMSDIAFADYRTDPQMKQFFKQEKP